MDDLDRLYYEFVEILRRERPSVLKDEPLTFAEVHDQVIPYPRIRNRVGFGSHEDYEATLTRMLAGERDYLASDRQVQEELRAGLEEALPDVRRFLAFPDVRVWLNPEKIPPPGDIRYAPPELREGVDWVSEAIESHKEERAALSPAEAGQAADVESDPQTPLEVCPQCGAEPLAGSVYCPFCGRRLLPDVCRTCGAQLDPAWSFCARCGSARGSSSESA
ncbi:MAG: zinc ribbon domain-containing protein [Gemmatimonadota bacterium]|nr:MAG: zinc ribbon domain-containing protein [Gemmatimonadota bacterium]